MQEESTDILKEKNIGVNFIKCKETKDQLRFYYNLLSRDPDFDITKKDNLIFQNLHISKSTLFNDIYIFLERAFSDEYHGTYYIFNCEQLDVNGEEFVALCSKFLAENPVNKNLQMFIQSDSPIVDKLLAHGVNEFIVNYDESNQTEVDKNIAQSIFSFKGKYFLSQSAVEGKTYMIERMANQKDEKLVTFSLLGDFNEKSQLFLLKKLFFDVLQVTKERENLDPDSNLRLALHIQIEME
jgi:hypothetical protein